MVAGLQVRKAVLRSGASAALFLSVEAVHPEFSSASLVRPERIVKEVSWRTWLTI